MITEVSLRNFRGIISGEIKLSPLTILIGPNNSGKTSILEALLLSHGLGEIFNAVRVYELLTELHRVLESRSLKHLIYGYGAQGERACIGYRVNGGLTTLIIVLTKSELKFYAVRDVGVDDALKLSSREFGKFRPIAVLRLDGSVKSYVSGFLNRVLFIRYDILKLAHGFLYSIWEELTGKGLTSEVATWISEILNEDFIDLIAEPFGGKPCINLYRSDKFRVRLGDFGDGAHMLIVARLLAEYLNPDLFLWDDVESHMNPLVLSLLAEWFSDLVERGKQVVVTTHSLEAAEVLATVVGEARIVRVINNKGLLVVKYYGSSDVEELKKLGIDVRA